MQNRHSQILLRVLSCGRMSEVRREPEVPEARVSVVECLGEKWHPPECLFYKSESGCRFGEKCSYAHRQVEQQPSKRSKKNGDKSAVAMLKKNEHHHRTGRLVKNAYSSNTRQLGCVFQNFFPPKCSSILRKSSDIRKPIRCEIHQGRCTSRLTSETKIHRLE